MKAIPIVPVKGGRVTGIRYDGGLRNNRDFHDVHLVMNHLTKVYDTTYFMDLDAIFTGDQQLQLLKSLCEINTVWVDPGVRMADDVIDPLVAGGEWVSMGTATMDSIEVIGDAVEFSNRVIPMVQWAEGKVLHRYHTGMNGMKDLNYHLDLFMDMGLESVIFMDLGNINRREGMDPDIIETLVGTGMKAYLAGGIKEQDALHLSGLGITGILLYINDLLEKISRERPRRIAVEPYEIIDIEPAVRLSPLGFPEFG
ncbi:MAG: hypothetical protein KAU14_00675 [Thermoplasmata archaeon]|nr:hypothetical protein [Thermoplasmata archaeon]